MDFSPTPDTPEQQAFRKEVAAWMKENVPDIQGDRDSDENYAKYREVGRKLGAKGWLRPTAPKEYGGGGLPLDQAIVITEEMAERDLGLPPYYDSGGWLGGASILVWGTEEQKKRFLPPIFNGSLVTWQLLTAPEAGSDLAGTTTEAVRDGDEYVLNGEKIFIGGSHGCDMMWTIARTGPKNERHKNLSWFMIPSDLPGVTIRPMDMLGDGGEGVGASVKNTIYFENVRVPASALVGGENNGWQVASTHLELEHGGGGNIGRETWFSRAVEMAKKLKKNGRPLLEDAEARTSLVDVFVHSEINRLFGVRNFWMNRTHQPMAYEGPQSSYYRKVHGLDITKALHDAFGPYASMNDEKWDVSGGELDQYMRGSIVALHPGGTADIQKVIMARRIGMGRDVAESAGKTVE